MVRDEATSTSEAERLIAALGRRGRKYRLFALALVVAATAGATATVWGFSAHLHALAQSVADTRQALDATTKQKEKAEQQLSAALARSRHPPLPHWPWPAPSWLLAIL